MPASEKTALEAVMEADEERVRLEKLAEELATMEDDAAQDYLMEVTLIKLISNNVLGELSELSEVLEQITIFYNAIRFTNVWMKLEQKQLRLKQVTC
jgi:hypothetical protein